MMDKFEKYVTSIKRKYQERLINREKQWPPCKSNKLVRLELVEGVKGEGCYARHMRGQEQEDVKRTPIKYEDLFKEKSGKTPVRRVLVEGDAGIGKTTLSIAVCEDWANEKLFQQFKLLLLLPLRHQKVASVGFLFELLQILHPSKALCASVAEYLEDSEGDGVLIIADGWDEVGKSDQLEEFFLHELLFEGYLPFASIIVTSRHSASTEFHKQSSFDRFVEITGFTKENIIEYIQSEFANEPSRADDLKLQLEANPLVESVCSVPLNCAIICYLWQHNHKEALPTTMTELYSMIIRNVILRNIGKDTKSTSILRLPSFDDLPKDLKQPWHFLCKFAYETMAKDQVVFSGDELGEELNSHKNFCFGLLQESLFLLDDGYGKSYHFLHRTFQEFLAAFHLARLASESGVVLSEIFQIGVSEIVWRFLFGIFFNVIICDNYHAIMPYLSYICGQPKNFSGTCARLCHAAFEAKNELVYKDVSQSFKDAGSALFSASHSAHDCTAIIDTISHVHDCSISIFFNNCHIRQEQVNHLGEVLDHHKNVQIKWLELTGNKFKLMSVERLFSAAQNSFQSLQHLDLKDNMIKTVNFFKLPVFINLESICLSNNPLGISGMNILKHAITGDSLTNLEILYLENCFTRDSPDSIEPTEFSEFLRALSVHCPLLSMLDLSQNNLGAIGVVELAKIKSQHNRFYSDHQKWLSSVILTKTKLGDEGLCAYIETLDCHVTWCFRELQLGGNDIHVPGLRCLVEAIGSGKIASTQSDPYHAFGLEDNPLGLEGVIEIGNLLVDMRQLNNLNLSRCQLTDLLTCDLDTHNELLIGQQLCRMHQNNSLMWLHLDGNKFTGDGIHILAGFMHLCPCLFQLNTKHCGISSSDLNQLLDKLLKLKSSGATKLCGNLGHWCLYGNKIDDKGVSALIEYRPSTLFPRLEGANKDTSEFSSDLNLGGNPVSNEMISILNKELNRTQEVRICTAMYGFLSC